MSIRISADSTCDLPRDIIEKYNIRILPLYIMIGERALQDGVDVCVQDIYDYTEKTARTASTAAVSLGDYSLAFSEDLKTYDSIVHFTISQEMSACYQNACLAAQEHPGRVHVIDCRSLSSGIGLLVLRAAELAAAGKSAGEIAEDVNRKKLSINCSFIINTLLYLHRGGRCSGVAMLGANLLHLKPCIELKNGVMGVGKKYRGDLRKCVANYISDHLEGEAGETVDKGRIIIVNSGIDEQILADADEAAKRAGFSDILHAVAGTTISGHCGPNTLGIMYFNKE